MSNDNDGLLILGLILLAPFITYFIGAFRAKRAAKLSGNLKKKILAQSEESQALHSTIEIAEKRADGLQTLIKTREKEFGEVRSRHTNAKEQLERTQTALEEVKQALSDAKTKLARVRGESATILELKENEDKLRARIQEAKEQLDSLTAQLSDTNRSIKERQGVLHETLATIDRYSRLKEFTDYGHFETPAYLYDTSEKYTQKIKAVRDQQKQMISDKTATIISVLEKGLETPSGFSLPEGALQTPDAPITGYKPIDNKIISGQQKMIIKVFNIECDRLIGTVKPSNYQRTLKMIDKAAADMEKLAATLRCGISPDYIVLKLNECQLQYEFRLKKQEEEEEQRLLREAMREEARAEREYREALQKAEAEERMYEEMLHKARDELRTVSEEERTAAELRIAELETALAEAMEKESRAKSLAEQTRRGHVYVISNIGSFGEGVYKIGMTRRLDPMDRVKELGDASVPFSFDVHAIIFSDDAPSMESELHRRFSHHRVNAVNLRKEFFRVDLDEIEREAFAIAGDNVDFKRTIAADEYYETLRLREDEPESELVVL